LDLSALVVPSWRVTACRLPPAAFLIALAAGALCAGACDNDTETSPTPTVTAGSITASPTGFGLAGATPYTFTASGFSSSTGELVTYAWDFGDRTTATGGATITHTYMIDWYVFKVTVIASTPRGATAQASLDGIRTKTVQGRWGIRNATGVLVFGSTFLAQNDASLHGDETWLNCRFDVSGSVVAPRSITLTYTRPPGDCQAFNVPVSLTFTGAADDGINSFSGPLTPGGAATLVKCPEPFRCQ
jgi:hypothetical protein